MKRSRAYLPLLVALLTAGVTVAPVSAQGAAAARIWSVTSPNGEVTFSLRRDAGGALSYRVTGRGGAEALTWSPLGILREDAQFIAGMRPVGEERRSIDEAYTLPHGKRSRAHARGRELRVTFATPAGARLEVSGRAYDEGAAFRYRFPGAGPGVRKVRGELTGFRLPTGSTGWMMPYDKPTQWTPGYENSYREIRIGTPSPTEVGWAFPALFRVPGGRWVLLTESGLDRSYAGTHLEWDFRERVYRIRFPESGEGEGVGDVFPASTLPWAMPWRVITVGADLDAIVSSALVTHLAPAPAARDWSWVRPGRSSWSWWSDSPSPKNPASLRRFIDLAADMRWEYSLIDANWNEMPEDTLSALLRHAAERGVGALLWYNSGGPHNVVTEAPRDRMHERARRRQEFAWLRDRGVKGIKVDFFQSDKQDRITQYIELMEDAADFQILLNFHGATIPRGWERTYPHLVTIEAVKGAEVYKFGADYPALAPSHNTILPFTRNAIGPMDYTPVTFSDEEHPHVTTSGHELALSVVFESGIQHFADAAESYRALPTDAREFLRDVPAAWDETRVLAGNPGSLAVIARRRGAEWFVGGISGERTVRNIPVTLGFLRAPAEVLLIRDGSAPRELASERRRVEAAGTVMVRVAPNGGFVMRVPAPSPAR